MEQRLSRLELLVKEIVEVVSANSRQNTALRAELDHLLAKLTKY